MNKEKLKEGKKYIAKIAFIGREYVEQEAERLKLGLRRVEDEVQESVEKIGEELNRE